MRTTEPMVTLAAFQAAPAPVPTAQLTSAATSSGMFREILIADRPRTVVSVANPPIPITAIRGCPVESIAYGIAVVSAASFGHKYGWP
jgi:hypothetical protein